ncbi:conserved hypothetical protein [Roseovarius sp. EC-HK134]|uniref:hypothetical protein n=1 Tax=unclassified Roseovarius TaxID=2614913 RepID=UPI00125749F0|nr:MULTISPECIES: hypothetical protein [unclassified Roseovarius]VVT29330.1 conserved hypothetical protein [Roseovarius sp. EC-SD190]VVT30354.1 conserved hypothetical protein [Roseovarius sp. EC-HK134]
MSSEPQVRRRRVFYIPGYDPIPPRRYRELYRKESAEQAVISGYEINVLQAKAQARFGWNVSAQIEGAEVESAVEVLVWSDIVKGSMDQGILATYVQLIRTAAIYIGTGALFRLMRLRKGPVIAALYPVGFLLVQLGIAFMVAWGLGRELALWHPWAAWGGLGVVPFILEWFRRLDGRFFAYYLMHDYAYSARYLGANPPELEARMAEFTAEIAQALQGDCDEVLVVGHSSGAHLGVSILADLIRGGQVPKHGPALSFLSLGQVVPMVSFLPRAYRLRADLAYLSARDEVTWVDVTAPGDGCAFALCDPVAVSGVAPKDKRWPLVISAAFTQTLSAERWRALRWRFFRLHFQYLCAFDRPGDFDYFRVTAGPLTLAARFRDRPPSKSRIERATSRYTSLAP